MNVFSVLEGAKVPSWWPARSPDIAADVAYYDACALSLAEWFNAYQGLRPAPEGRIIVHP